MCDATRGRCAAEEFLKDKPTQEQMEARVVEVVEDDMDDEQSWNYVNAFVATLNPHRVSLDGYRG